MRQLLGWAAAGDEGSGSGIDVVAPGWSLPGTPRTTPRRAPRATCCGWIRSQKPTFLQRLAEIGLIELLVGEDA
ncbi:hypothetical protein AB0284_20145 [Pseudarthrobacter phenanthrenivorans]|uniref:hypothetical protein n=1 Tax=Pseudarthrobacter phenanthrenivorans TaxID=361575 RepID=UPI00344DEAA9